MSENDRADRRRPHVLTNTLDAARAALDSGDGGAVWRIDDPHRGLDSNLVALPAGDGITEHRGPDLDVLVHVVRGSGTLTRGGKEIALAAGDLVLLPRLSERGFRSGPDGLVYLTVHARKGGLRIGIPG